MNMPAEQHVDQRHSKRVTCQARATLYHHDVVLGSAVIKDISTGGMKLYMPANTWLPNQVRIKTPLLDTPIEARLTWRHGDHFGVRFNLPPAAIQKPSR